MVKPWRQHREKITELYIKEAKTLDETKRIMDEDFGFIASIRSYRQRFDQWDLQKYNCKKRQQRKLHERQKQHHFIQKGYMYHGYPSPPTTPEDAHAMPVVTGVGVKPEGGAPGDGHSMSAVPGLGVKLEESNGRYFAEPSASWHYGEPLAPLHPNLYQQHRPRYLKQMHVLERKYEPKLAPPSGPWYNPVEPNQEHYRYLPSFNHDGFPQQEAQDVRYIRSPHSSAHGSEGDI